MVAYKLISAPTRKELAKARNIVQTAMPHRHRTWIRDCVYVSVYSDCAFLFVPPNIPADARLEIWLMVTDRETKYYV